MLSAHSKTPGATEEERSAPLDDQVASPTCPVQEKRCSKRTVRMLDVEEMVGIDVESPSESDDSVGAVQGAARCGVLFREALSMGVEVRSACHWSQQRCH